MGDINILTFCPTVLDKKCHFPVYFLNAFAYSFNKRNWLQACDRFFCRMRGFSKCLAKSDKKKRILVI